MLEGIDVSRWQPTTPSLAGLSFLFAKASQGTSKDPMYDTHIANARKAGLVVGAYCFNVGGADIAGQVTAFLAAAGAVDLYAIDVEGTAAFTPAETADFIKRVQATGRKCGLYHSASGYFDAGQDWNWVAKWGTAPPTTTWAFWQYQGSPLDRDRFNGTLDDLHALIGGDMATITASVRQSWTATDEGVLRASPDRAAPISDHPPKGTVVETFVELEDATGNHWRGLVYAGNIRYLLRYGPGVAADHDWVAGAIMSTTDAAALDTARRNGYNAGLAAAQQAVSGVKPI